MRSSEERQTIILESKELLHKLFASWQSVYKYTISFNSMTENIVFFDTEWCRTPVPHQPVPEYVVTIHFAIRYKRIPDNPLTIQPEFTPSSFTFPLPTLTLGTPSVSWRVKQEETLHYDLNGVDLHVLRALKSGTLFKHAAALVPEHDAVFTSRVGADIDPMEQRGLGEAGDAPVIDTSSGSLPKGFHSAVIERLNDLDDLRLGVVPYDRFFAGATRCLSEYGLYCGSSSSANAPLALCAADLAQVFLAAHLEHTAAQSRLGMLSARITGAPALNYSARQLAVAHALPVPISVPVSADEPAVPVWPAETTVPVLILARTLVALLKALCAVRAARNTHARTLSDSARISRTRVSGCPELHEMMGEQLLALDPHHTGSVSALTLTRFLARLPLALDEAEIADILARLPTVAPEDRDMGVAAVVAEGKDAADDHADADADADAGASELISYLPLQCRYESLLRQTARARAVNALRGELGIHLHALLDTETSGAGARVGMATERSAGAMLQALSGGRARVNIPAMQAYALLRGLVPRQAAGNAAGGQDVDAGGARGAHSGVFGLGLGLEEPEEDLEAYADADADGACGCTCAGVGVDANTLVNVAKFTLLAGLALSKLHAGVLDAPHAVSALGPVGEADADDEGEADAVDEDGKVRMGALLVGARADSHLDSRVVRILENSEFSAGLDAGLLLDQHDADDDGRLSFAEFDSCVTATGVRVTRAEIRELFLVADRDGDGWVDRAELETVVAGLLGQLAVAQKHNDMIDAAMRAGQ